MRLRWAGVPAPVLPVAMAVPAVAAGGGLAVRAWRARPRLPAFADLDLTGEYGDPTGPGVAIVALGDSTLTGPGLGAPGEIWLAQIASALPYRVRLVRLARGGARVRDVLDTQLPPFAELDAVPDVAVLAVGANDALHGTPPGRFARDLARVLDVLAAAVPETVVFGVGDLGVIPRAPRAARLVLSARSRAIDRRHEQVTAGRPAVTRVASGRLTNRQFRERGAELFAADRFHPNREGQSIWAGAFHGFVAEAVTRAADGRAAACGVPRSG